MLLWSTTALLNSALLFWLELVIAKLLLPSLGGSAAVWNTCLMFFQVTLVAGYAYAHLSASRLSDKGSAFLHLALLLAALAVLPVSENVPAQGDTPPVVWLLSRLAVMIGLPFFVLASHGPLLQAWHARSGHGRSREPYFLFAAGNAGSLIGLLAFPLLLEPLFGLTQQIRIWTSGFVLLVLLVCACRFGPWHRYELAAPAPAAATSAPHWPQRLQWLVYSAVPSSLLLGVTSYIAADVASVPLLWVLPLALYLATFVIAFSRSTALRAIPERLTALKLFSKSWVSWSVPILTTAVLMALISLAISSVLWLICLHLLAFFGMALHLHSQLAARRPAAQFLGQFYLWIGLGGALGGVFNALLAPLLFTRVHEYPFVLALALMLRPSIFTQKIRVADFVLPALLAGAMAAVPLVAYRTGYTSPAFDLRLVFIIPVLVLLRLYGRTLLFGLSVLALLWALPFYPEASGWPVHVERSFYNVHRVIDDTGHGIRWLENGNTLHGAQNIRRPGIPLGYYDRSGPVGDVLAAGNPYRRVAVVGLGAGGMFAYARTGDEWTFYELDPAVIHIARDSGLFTFVAAGDVRPRIVAGDGRLQLAAAAEHSYDLVVIDAFGSDSIPVHLLTDEAFSLYLSRAAEAPRLLFNVSNRYLDLAPLLAGLARKHGLNAFHRIDDIELRSAGELASHWVMVTDGAAPGPSWLAVPAKQIPDTVWTDNYSSVLYLLNAAHHGNRFWLNFNP